MNKIKTIIATALLSLSTTVVAQNLESGYFTDGYLYSHDLNPAFGNDQGYVSIPALGSFNLDVRGTLGLGDVLFNRQGKTVTFLNPNVSVDEFKSGIKDDNKFNESLRLQILSFGFKGFGGYNTIEVNARQDFALTVPGTLLIAMKEGLTNQTYDFSNFTASADAFAEIAIGHSHQVNDKLRIGAKAKVLLGVGHVEANFNKAELTLGTDAYKATVDAEIQASLKDLKYETKLSENTHSNYISGIDDATAGLAGFGLALDLGAEYKVTEDLRLSAAILDLGFINYSKTFLASTNGTQTFQTSKYTFNTDNNDDVTDAIEEDIAKLYELKDKGDQGSTKTSIGTTFRAGVEYALPVYRNLTFGLLNTTRTGNYSWTDFRLSANIAPVKFFSAGVNIDTGTYGTGFGWIVNLHPTGFNLYLAMDRMLGSLAKQGVPLNSNASLSMGVNIPF